MKDRAYDLALEASSMLAAIGFLADDLVQFGKNTPNTEKDTIVNGFQNLCTYAAKGINAELAKIAGGK